MDTRIKEIIKMIKNDTHSIEQSVLKELNSIISNSEISEHKPYINNLKFFNDLLSEEVGILFPNQESQNNFLTMHVTYPKIMQELIEKLWWYNVQLNEPKELQENPEKILREANTLLKKYEDLLKISN